MSKLVLHHLSQGGHLTQDTRACVRARVHAYVRMCVRMRAVCAELS